MQQLKSFFCGHVAFSKQIKVRYNLKTKGQLTPAIFLGFKSPKKQTKFLKDFCHIVLSAYESLTMSSYFIWRNFTFSTTAFVDLYFKIETAKFRISNL